MRATGQWDPAVILSFDLDGVIYRGSNLIEHAAAAVNQARRLGYPVYFGTNNTHYGAEAIAARLSDLGISARPEHVVCAADATAWVLAELDPPARRALVMGTEHLAEEIERAGIETVRFLDDGSVDVVVASLDLDLSFRVLSHAHWALRHAGARLVVPSHDRNFPWSSGSLPGGGALATALSYSAEVDPIMVGKPATRMFDEILKRENARPRDLVLVGDNLETDIGAAKALGARSVLVYTGVSDRADLARTAPAARPDFAIPDLSRFPWEELAGS